MSWRIRIFSLAILALIIIPVFVGQNNSGSVLGIMEDRTGDNGGTIAGGILDNRMDQSTEAEVGKTLAGKVKLDPNSKIQLQTPHFRLSSPVTIRRAGDTMEIKRVVGSNQSIDQESIIALVNRDTFIELGGNPESTDTLDVEILAD